MKKQAFIAICLKIKSLLLCLFVTQAMSAIGNKSKKMCEKYGEAVYQRVDSPVLLPQTTSKNVSQCGIVEVPLIIGGERAGPKEFPHMVVIGFGLSPKDQLFWQCGGSLISDYFVLTAAHCLNSRDKGNSQMVRLGDLDIAADKSNTQEKEIVERIAHPQYKLPSKYFDIALIKLTTPVTFDAFIRPACISTDSQSYGHMGIATGIGRIKYEDTEGSPHLMKVQITFINTSVCNASYSKDIERKSSAISSGVMESQLCAGEMAGGKDTCQGDSGGPLQIVLAKPYCMYSVVGVTSFGKFCGYAESPAIYTRVSYFIEWIENKVWGD